MSELNEKTKARKPAVEAPEELKPTEPVTVKITRPVKDLNGMVYTWEEVEVPAEAAAHKPVPGGLAGKPPF